MNTEWKRFELKDPVSFRLDGESYIIRKLSNVKAKTMCELEMDDDKVMMPFTLLPEKVRSQISKQADGIKL